MRVQAAPASTAPRDDTPRAVWHAATKRMQAAGALERMRPGFGEYLWFYVAVSAALPEVAFIADTTDYGCTLWCLAERGGKLVTKRPLVGAFEIARRDTGEIRWRSCDVNGADQWDDDDEREEFRLAVVAEFVDTIERLLAARPIPAPSEDLRRVASGECDGALSLGGKEERGDVPRSTFVALVPGPAPRFVEASGVAEYGKIVVATYDPAAAALAGHHGFKMVPKQSRLRRRLLAWARGFAEWLDR